MQFIDLKAQYSHLKQKIDARIHQVLEHGQYILGPEVKELEKKLADYVGVKHCISCANGTDALTLAFMASGIGEGDAVFCPTFTFFASAETIAHAGATPIFVDADADTFNLCTQDLERRIEATLAAGKLIPKAIVSVDLFGLPADYPAIKRLADKYKLLLIEDAAQGFGGRIGTQEAGSFADIATTSFFPAKPLGCYGDGGALFTNDDAIAELLSSLRFHGKGSDKYDNVRIGLNSRLDTLQAAILLEKLDVFPQELLARQQVAQHYNNTLPKHLKRPIVPQGYYSSWAQYTVQSIQREEDMAMFKAQGIPTMVYYPTCMHQQTAFTHLGYRTGDFPVAERLVKQVFSLPMHPYFSQEDYSKISKACQ